MTLYLDTSALVKLYVSEAGSRDVVAWLAAARLLFTASITYAEARAAFAQSRRLGVLSQPELRRVVTEFDAAWSGYNAVDINESLVLRAGQLAEEHALRGYDAVQLAAALEARPTVGEYLFASFDAHLNTAAEREGLHLAHPAEKICERSGPGYGVRVRGSHRARVAASGRSR